MEVTVASVESSLQITASRQTKLVADVLIADAFGTAQAPIAYDGMFCPGGMPGAERLRDSKPLIDALKAQKASGRWYGAICASPAVVLHTHGLLSDIASVTCHPNFKAKLNSDQSTKTNEPRVVVSGNCVTSIGPGSSIEYALAIVELLCGAEKMKAVAEPMYCHLPSPPASKM